MKIFDYKRENGLQIYETPFIRVPLADHRCRNLAMLLLLTQWIQTERDCRIALRLIGRELGLGHLTNYELILLLDRVDVELEELFQVSRIQEPGASRDRFMRSFYSEFVNADLDARNLPKTEVCAEVQNVWEVLPDLMHRIIKMMKDAREISRFTRSSTPDADIGGEI